MKAGDGDRTADFNLGKVALQIRIQEGSKRQWTADGSARPSRQPRTGTYPWGWGGSRADYKPGSVPAGRVVAIYLRRRSPGASSDRYPRARRATLSPAGLRCPAGPLTRNALLFGLAPGGVCLAGRSPGRRWALTPPFHPYRPLPEEEPAVSFLWHFPSGHPDWGLPSALLYGARTFLSDSRRKRSGHPSASTRSDFTTSASVRRSPGWPGHRPPGSSPAARG